MTTTTPTAPKTPSAGTTPAARLSLDVWLDIACPWCAIGELRLASVIRELPFSEQIDVRFHSYQLAPDAPDRADMLQPEFLASRGMDMTRFRAAQQQLVEMGAEYDFHFDQDRTVPSNTHTAHRLIQAAGAAGPTGTTGAAVTTGAPGTPGTASIQAAVIEALFSAYFEHGRDLGDPAVLRDVVTAAGLPAAEADRVLADPDAHRADVADDIARAAQLGISGVPFVVADGRYGISGAQPQETFADALNRVYAELTAAASAAGGQAAVDSPAEDPAATSAAPRDPAAS